jgi:hypothetical protein
VCNKTYADTKLALNGSSSMTGNFDMGNNTIINTADYNLENNGGRFLYITGDGTYIQPQQSTNILHIARFGTTDKTLTINTQSKLTNLYGVLNMNTQYLTGVRNGESASDAVNLSQLDTKLNIAGGSMDGVLNMNNNNLIMSNATGVNSAQIQFPNNNRILTISNNDMVMYRGNDHYIAVGNAGPYVGSRLNLQTNKIIGLGAGTSGTDAINKNQLDDGLNTKISIAGGTLFGAINMNSNKITGLGPGTAGTDAVNKSQLDAVAGGKYSDSFKATLVNFTPLIVGTFTFDNITSKASSRAFLIDGFLNCSYTDNTNRPIGISYTCDYFNSANVLISDEDAGFTYGTALTIGSTYYFNLASQDIITVPALCTKVVVKFRTSTASGNVVSKNGRAILTIKDLVGL